MPDRTCIRTTVIHVLVRYRTDSGTICETVRKLYWNSYYYYETISLAPDYEQSYEQSYEQGEFWGNEIEHAAHVRFVVLSAVLGIRSALVRNAGGHSSILYVSRARFGLFYRRTPCESGSL